MTNGTEPSQRQDDLVNEFDASLYPTNSGATFSGTDHSLSEVHTANSTATTNTSNPLVKVPSKDFPPATSGALAGSSAPSSSNVNKDLPKASVELLNEEKIKLILNSDSALEALLKRLKESITNCEEFAKFIKKKAAFQEEYDYQVRKLSKSTSEYLRHNAANLRQDSFTKSFEQIVGFDDKLYSVGSAYVAALKTMSDELFQLSATMQRQRRALKDDGKRREKEVADAVSAAEKAKSRYENFCVELDKVRHYEPTRKFTLKNKTTSQQEEELMSKIEIADKDYASKVNTSKRLKEELLSTHRPAVSKSLKDLILEIDLAMCVQLQKYATWCENLLMNSGVLISPLRSDSRQASMKSLAASVDNEKDLHDYLLKYSNAGPSRALLPVDYKVHSVLTNTQANFNTASMGNNGGMTSSASANSFTSNIKRSSSILMKKNKINTSPVQTAASLSKVQEDSKNSTKNNRYSYINTGNNSASMGGVSGGQTNTLDPFYNGANPTLSVASDGGNSLFLHENRSQSALPSSQELSTIKPISNSVPKMFGGSIEELCLFENESVPLIVRTCINIIDNYGIELEGIYRTSGNKTKIHQLIDALNIDRSMIDKLITNPDRIIDSDMFCIASLLKSYFSQLPQALLTEQLYARFVSAVKIPEVSLRKKRLHEVVYELPDANYFTLRAVIFHLCRIVEKQEINRMSARNLGIIWGPNLLPQNHLNKEDLNVQGLIVENLMYIAADIFEPEGSE
ncbi:GTPase-activating protein [Saccharomycopsis crataegensis]|uniref:GTPase-activating protein n=1 Tax=Saccharomycopsis crataegensis TaxID=43959 RepID=A0AAV5QDA1_9ASCO|nr:GTPase-activating protein [Saccharomycopsis crataegensis]